MKKTAKLLILLLVLTLLLSSFVCCVETDDEGDEESIDYSIDMNTEYKRGSGLADGGGEKIPVILLLGQSNASGCSIVEYLSLNASEEDFARYSRGYDNILINYCIDNHHFSSEGGFVKVDLSCGCGNGFFGPEVGLADTLDKKLSGERVIILKYTMSGYSLANHWLRDGERSDIYNACALFVEHYMDYLAEMNYKPVLKAICWMQGESDTAEKNAVRYYDNQVKFVDYLRADFDKYNDGEIYFIDAGISSSPYCEPGYPVVNEAKERISKLSQYNLYFSTIDAGLTTLYEPDYAPDLGHYDSLCEIKLGEMFGERVASILQSDDEK